LNDEPNSEKYRKKAKEEIMPIELGSFSLGTFVGGVIVGFVNHYLTKSRSVEDRKIREFNDAATKFRNAFKDEVLALDPSLSRDIGDIEVLLTNAFAKHRSAVFDFLPMLTGEDAKAFEKAWHEYYRSDKEPDDDYPFFGKYSEKWNGTIYDRVPRMKLAQERINVLLSFAHNR